MVLEERMQEWLQNYCKACSGSCCNNSSLYRVLLNKASVSLFQEKGIPFVGVTKLDKSSLISWKEYKTTKLFLTDGSEVQKPSIVEIPKRWFNEIYLYADVCPFYNEGKGCGVHEDPRRPEVCKKYPIYFLESTGPERELKYIRVMESCECLRNPERRRELTEKFKVRIVDA